MGIGRVEVELSEDDASRRRELLSGTEQLAQTGSWDWDLCTNEAVWSDNVFRLFGFEPREVTPTPEFVADRTHPDDRARVWRCAEARARDETRPALDYRIASRRRGPPPALDAHPGGAVRGSPRPADRLGAGRDRTAPRPTGDRGARRRVGRAREVDLARHGRLTPCSEDSPRRWSSRPGRCGPWRTTRSRHACSGIRARSTSSSSRPRRAGSGCQRGPACPGTRGRSASRSTWSI